MYLKMNTQHLKETSEENSVDYESSSFQILQENQKHIFQKERYTSALSQGIVRFEPENNFKT